MNEEIWKDIDDFPGYQVSNQGRVRSFWTFQGNLSNEPKIMKLVLNKDNYFEVCILDKDKNKRHKRVHRLMADAFLGPQPDLVVNHIDGNKHNNTIENIEWVTAKENSTLASKNGLYKTQPIKIVETGEVFKSVKECAKAVGIHPTDVSHVMAGRPSSRNLHYEYISEKEYSDKTIKRKPFLYDYQIDAVNRMKNGCILNGGVGSGKSRTSLFYYFKENGGWIDEYGYKPMKNPKDLYIITTARKRDTLEWEGELVPFLLSTQDNSTYPNLKIVVDSWNNIQKYADITNAFFIFDEQRVVGSGAWVKAFLKIARTNNWILLSATPGDCFMDYVPVFIANGFYKNRTEFIREHVVYKRFSKFPQIDRYINTGRLIRLRNRILIDMDFARQTTPHHEDVYCQYDISTYKDVMRNRWNIYKNEPITSASDLCFTLRRIVNSDESRQTMLLDIVADHPRAIIFYNYDYELEILKGMTYIYDGEALDIAEWNGHKHQPIPNSDKWVYLVQYTSGCEGWNCIKTDTIIFYSQNYSYKVMAQACGRIDRLNTPYKDLYYYHLRSRSGIDLAISKALSKKKNFNEGRFVKW